MRALVFGASGQIGHFLLPLLCEHHVEVEAVTRQPRAVSPGITWTRMDLYALGDVAQAPDVVFSVGPLDGLLAWLARTRHRPGRVVAFSSTSADTKLDSPDRAERALATHLQRSEMALATHCDARGIGWTILRPTLVYGCGLDQNLSRVAALAQRWRVVPLPRDASGLRQPVHAQDLAICAWRAANTGESLGKTYDLAGGERVSYTEMVRRTVSCLEPRGYLLRLPGGLFRIAALAASHVGAVPGLTAGMLERLRQDLVFSSTAAEHDLGWSPRPFQPDASNFRPPVA